VMDDKGGEEKTIKAYLFVVVKPVWPVLQTSLTGLCWAISSSYVSSHLLS
jgi:hypothetical protein